MPDRGVFVSWVREHGRSHDLAVALGLHEVNYPASIVGLPRPLRYLAATLATKWLLVRRRPRAVVVMSPPPIPVLLAGAYCLLTGRTLVIDAHSGAFNRPAWRAMSQLSFRLLSRCRRGAVIVTNDEMRAEAESWTTHPVIELHDLLTRVDLPESVEASCDAFVVAAWADDEPLAELADAMAGLPGLRVVVSGRPASDAARRRLEEAGVTVPGYLSDEDYRRTLAGAGVVVALTTRDGTMQRGGYEAASAGKALVTSDTRVLREYFGAAAVHTAPEPAAIAAAIRDALTRRTQLESAMRELRDSRLAAQAEGLRRLAAVLAQ